MQRQTFRRWLVAIILCLGCLTAQAAASVHERDWTCKTPWGPVGIYRVTYAGSADSLSVVNSRLGYVQLYIGPLGKVSVSIDPAKDAARLRATIPVVLAIGVVGYVWWSYRRKPAEVK